MNKIWVMRMRSIELWALYCVLIKTVCNEDGSIRRELREEVISMLEWANRTAQYTLDPNERVTAEDLFRILDAVQLESEPSQ